MVENYINLTEKQTKNVIFRLHFMLKNLSYSLIKLY